MDLYFKKSDGEIVKKNFEYAPKSFFQFMESEKATIVHVEPKLDKDGNYQYDDENNLITKVKDYTKAEVKEVKDKFELFVEKRKPKQKENTLEKSDTYTKGEVIDLLDDLKKEFETNLAELEKNLKDEINKPK